MRKKYITIFTGELARYLLKKGYTITDIKAHKDIDNASIFVFKNDEGLMRNVHEFKEQNDR